ncbi:GerMN domain-containing protein [Solwaraspora sp. WMMD1047]|uniref:GerMN domain-containing protein n=1 Tax=Solwaraspora sp. WMMD1047 TaxID=3016102 RepID=UPI0024161AC5|nr:GerMN domain-containing protein [Solwaraspora sp. WMMD1047]MDG4831727.1 GerMN domain-containing protein [Solwaraspora sp. WMMD1047]
MTSRPVRLAALAIAGLLLGACGVPPEDEPRAVDLPRRSLTSASPSAGDQGRPGQVTEVHCLVRDGRLVRAVRRIESIRSPQHQVEALIAGPTNAERETGLTSALAGLSLAVQVSSDTLVAQVEITEADEGNARIDEMIAYAQIVCTLTARSDVDSVVFTRGDERLDVPRADGSLSRGPLYGSDYSSLLEPG